LLSVPVSDEEEVNSERERKVRADQLPDALRGLPQRLFTTIARGHLSTRGGVAPVALHELFGKPADYPTYDDGCGRSDPAPASLAGDLAHAKSECQ
jgi:hypothetical protein